jgi:hypothetical protein
MCEKIKSEAKSFHQNVDLITTDKLEVDGKSSLFSLACESVLYHIFLY